MAPQRRVSAVRVRAFAARLVALSAVFALAVLAQLGVGEPYSERQLTALYALVGLGFLLALVYGALATSGRIRSPVELAGDGVLITAVVYCSGGSGSLYVFLYVLWIVYAALTAGARGSIVAWGAAMTAYSTMVFGEAGGWLPAYEGHRELELRAAFSSVGVHAVAFLSAAFLSHRLARQVQVGREELHELGEIYQRIVDNVASGLLTVDRGGEITSFNAEAERITGCAARDVVGQPLVLVFPTLRDLAVTANDSDGRSRLQLGFRSRDGEDKFLGMSISALRDSVGREDGAILVFQDLTRIVEMEDQLRRSERLGAVGQLATGLAHEIRNPLTSLSGAVELLAADLPAGDASTRRLSQIVRRETARLDRLVGDFLTYARPAPARAEPVALYELVDEMRQLLAAGEHADVEIVLEMPRSLRALGNDDQLRQVLWNLVLNAVQAGPIDGRVVVRGRAQAEPAPDGKAGVELEVADRGAGIPPTLLERVFEPFFTTKPKGTGLGLSTVYRIVEAYGGELAVSSTPGEGTTVRIWLPAPHS